MLDISDPAGTADHPGLTRPRTTKQRIGTAISGPIARFLTPDVAGVAALTAATATVYTVFEIEQQRHFQTAGYDLGVDRHLVASKSKSKDSKCDSAKEEVDTDKYANDTKLGHVDPLPCPVANES